MNRCSDTLNTISSRRWHPLEQACSLILSGAFAFTVPAALTTALVLSAPAALAQGVGRPIPKDVKFGHMVVVQPPEVTMDGQPDRLSPGARIRHTNNLLVLSGTVVGQTLPVVYRRDTYGLIHQVWLLSPEEAAQLESATGSGFTQALNTLLGIIFGVRR